MEYQISVGNMGGGLLDFIATNWIPLGQNHWLTYVAQVVIGYACITNK
jgi:PTS system arbutin-like IIC component